MNDLYVDKKNTQLEIDIQDDPSKFNAYQWAFFLANVTGLTPNPTSK